MLCSATIRLELQTKHKQHFCFQEHKSILTITGNKQKTNSHSLLRSKLVISRNTLNKISQLQYIIHKVFLFQVVLQTGSVPTRKKPASRHRPKHDSKTRCTVFLPQSLIHQVSQNCKLRALKICSVMSSRSRFSLLLSLQY